VAERAEGRSKMRREVAIAALALMLVFVFVAITTQSAQAQTFTSIYRFTGSSGDEPFAGLVQDAEGNLYGTTELGGGANLGVVFKIDTAGAETVLHDFEGGADGQYPYAALVLDKSGNLYGTTSEGGSSNQGTVFRVDRAGNEAVLHSFAGGTSDGCNPYGGLIEDKAGNLYGTTPECGASSEGTVFKVTKKGKETVLHSFAGGSSDGGYPFYGNLLMDKKGNLYGVTEVGGSSSEGVLYKLSKSGRVTVLYSFTGGTSDGCYPFGTPARDKKGDFYGTTETCGSTTAGTVWKVSKKGTDTILHNFADAASDGAYPFAGVVVDAKGNLFGVTQAGGASGAGVVYEVSKSGTFTLVHSFSFSDGSQPFAGLLQDATGALYGTTIVGGTDSAGTVWSLK